LQPHGRKRLAGLHDLANVDERGCGLGRGIGVFKFRFLQFRDIRQVLGIVNVRYEGGLTLQDTTYATTSPLFLPYRQALATVDLGVVAPIWKGATVQAGVKNLLDRNYYYNAGFPEAGRTWFLNFRYSF
jgi:outer membrane receptor protein involved in Fe transport